MQSGGVVSAVIRSACVGIACVIAAAPVHANTHDPEPPPPPAWDAIAFDMKSWGEPISSWRIGNDGSGAWVETEKAENAALGDYTLAYHDIDPDVQLYVAVERLTLQLPSPAPDPGECDNFMTDMPYGTIRLTKGATTTEIAWNAGCQDDDYRAFLDLLKQADTLVSAAGRDGPVVNRVAAPGR